MVWSKGLFQKIIDALPIHFYWTGKDTQILGANFSQAINFGYKDVKECINKNIDDLAKKNGWDKKTTKRFRQEHLNVIHSGKPNVAEHTRVLADGSEHTEMSYLNPLILKGNAVGVVGASIDISSLKKIQSELEIAKNRAEVANRVKTEFIANISHDIRTPITGMLGLLQSLSDKTKHTAIESEFNLLTRTTHELLGLLNDVIHLVTENPKELVREKTDFDLKELIDRNCKLFAPNIKNKGLTFHMVYAADCPSYFKGHLQLLSRVLLNLISNAVKFTDQGAISLLVDAENKNAREVKLNITVKDTGIGIPKDKLQTIFHRFSRLNPSYQGLYAGYGLGLHSVKKYITFMGGSIKVKSKINQGSEFIIKVPLLVSSREEVEKNATRHKLIAFAEAHANNAHFGILGKNISNVLLVEDDALSAQMAMFLLEKMQCRVKHVVSGEETLRLLEHEYFDLIFMDIGLPDMNGFAVTKQIRKMEAKSKRKFYIVALSGHVGEEHHQSCLKAGMDATVTKPLSKEIITALLQNFSPAKHISKLPAATKPKEFDCLDLEAGARLIDGNRAKAVEMLQLFATSLPTELMAIKKAKNAKNYNLLLQITHKLYGGLCYLGAPKLRECARKLQNYLKEGGQEKEQIEILYSDFIAAISEFKASVSKL